MNELDIRKFYDSIDHDILKNMFRTEIEVSDDPSDPSSPKRTMWEYDEREIPVDEYAAMQSPVMREIMQALSGLELQIAELG